MGLGRAFAAVKNKQAGRLARKDTAGEGTKAPGEPDFSKGVFQGPQGITSRKIRSSFAANPPVPTSIRHRALYLGRGGELEHFGKFESRHHAGTIFKGKRELNFFGLATKQRGFYSSWNSRLRPITISPQARQGALLASCALPEVRDLHCKGKPRSSRKRVEGCR